MTLLPLLIMASLEFLPRDLPPFPPNTAPFFPLGAADYRLADINGDGRRDWLLPACAVLQQESGLNTSAPIPMPRTQAATLCDCFGNNLYMLTQNRLHVYALKENAFAPVLEQPFSWLDTEDSGATPELDRFAGRRQGLAFERFLQDFDGDGVPEIALPHQAGLVIFEKRPDGRYHRAAAFDVFPPMAVPRLAPQGLWPEDERELLLPPRIMACQFGLEAGQLRVLTWEDVPGKQVRYHIVEDTITREQSGAHALSGRREQHSEAVPAFMQPMQLNNDGLMDYAGGDWTFSRNALLPTPVATICVSLDGGKTIQHIRSVAFSPAPSFADIDGDGDMDLAVESTCMFEGGAREVLARFLSARETAHELHVYLQDGAGFSREPAMKLRVAIHFDAPPARRTNRLLEYQRGNLLNVTGDVDGDKRCDAAVFARPGQIDVYQNRGAAFSGRPDAAIPVPENADFDIVDADGDGDGDIIVGWNDEKGIRRGRIFFAKGGNRP